VLPAAAVRRAADREAFIDWIVEVNMNTLDIDKVAAAIEADARDVSVHKPASSVALPPAAAVLTVTVCSPQNRYR
jgi:hypothetical protein